MAHEYFVAIMYIFVTSKNGSDRQFPNYLFICLFIQSQNQKNVRKCFICLLINYLLINLFIYIFIFELFYFISSLHDLN